MEPASPECLVFRKPSNLGFTEQLISTWFIDPPCHRVSSLEQGQKAFLLKSEGKQLGLRRRNLPMPIGVFGHHGDGLSLEGTEARDIRIIAKRAADVVRCRPCKGGLAQGKKQAVSFLDFRALGSHIPKDSIRSFPHSMELGLNQDARVFPEMPSKNTLATFSFDASGNICEALLDPSARVGPQEDLPRLDAGGEVFTESCNMRRCRIGRSHGSTTSHENGL